MTQDERISRNRRKNGPGEAELAAATPAMAGGREVRVGIFVLVGFLAVITILFLFTDPATFRGRYYLVTEVEDAGGVRRGDPVQMRGVNIGRVHGFEMANEGVRMSLEIYGRWRVPEDSYSRITGMGLLGGRTVEVVPGSSQRMLSGAEILPGSSGERVEELATEVGVEVRELLARTRLLMDDSTIASVRGSAGELETLLVAMNAVVGEQRGELRALTASLLRSAREIEEAATGEELTRALARAEATMEVWDETGRSLMRSSEALESLLARIEAGEGTLGRLATDDALYDNVSDAVTELRELIQDIRENPGRYIRLRVF